MKITYLGRRAKSLPMKWIGRRVVMVKGAETKTVEIYFINNLPNSAISLTWHLPLTLSNTEFVSLVRLLEIPGHAREYTYTWIPTLPDVPVHTLRMTYPWQCRSARFAFGDIVVEACSCVDRQVRGNNDNDKTFIDERANVQTELPNVSAYSRTRMFFDCDKNKNSPSVWIL